MEQPPRFVAQKESGMVCKLRRYLYGLKQSPLVWFGKFSSIVQRFGLKDVVRQITQSFTHTLLLGHVST